MQGLRYWIIIGILLVSSSSVSAQLTDKSFVLNEVETDKTAKYVPGQLIVKFKAGLRTEAMAAMATSYPITLNKSIQGAGIDLFSISEAVDMDAMIDKLEADPSVEYVEPNFYLWPTAVPNDTYFNQQWGLRNSGQDVRGRRGTAGADIDATAAWDITKGSRNVIVAVIDTGAAISHPDIAPNLWYNTRELNGARGLSDWRPNGVDDDGNGYVDDVVGWDFVNNVNNPRDLVSGHGTHVAGIAAASGNNGQGVSGVSWRSRIMPLAVYDYSNGGLPTSAVVEALAYAQRMGAQVINMSLGGYGTSQALRDAVNQTTSPVICAAAGNDGRNNDTSPHVPSNYPNANLIAVAATDQSDQLASFSNFGKTSVDVAAPGVNIASTYIRGSGYAYISGTSMATPMVAGIAALVLSQRPGLSAPEVVTLLKSSVDRIGSLAAKLETGGRVNALKALQSQPPGEDDGGGGCFIQTLQRKTND